MIGQVFLAGSDTDARTCLESGPFRDGVLDAVAVGELTPLEFDALQSVLTGVPFRDVLESDQGGMIDAGTDAGPWVSRMRDGLATALATVPDDWVASTAAAWADRDEVSDVGTDILVAVLGPLRQLARTAGERGLRMYLWNQM